MRVVLESIENKYALIEIGILTNYMAIGGRKEKKSQRMYRSQCLCELIISHGSILLIVVFSNDLTLKD